jgi:hypothetical protein
MVLLLKGILFNLLVALLLFLHAHNILNLAGKYDYFAKP